MNISPLKIIENDAQFEELCCAIAQYKYGDFDAQKYGRSGQKQFGADIKAIDRKSNNEKIVIQCKFKNNPPTLTTKGNSERNTIEKEIESELAKAIEGSPFDYFVYASNIPRDTHLQNFAARLSTEDYKVIIWSQADISDDIYRYHRLKELYTLGGNKFGVEIINTDFIDTLTQEAAIANPNIFRYYASSDIYHTQWYGILNNWDVIRSEQHTNFLNSIHDSFSNEFIESKIAGLIIGEGGAGKSVFLRRIAIELCKHHKDIVVWWVTDIESFWYRDVSCIDDNPQYKHLIIIEDWYRNIGNDYTYSKPMFNWLKTKYNVRVAIGDRTMNKGYRNYITKRNKFTISLDENFTILETITEKLPELHENIQKLLENDALIRSSPIFIILFVLSELNEEAVDIDYDHLNFENVFQQLIGKKISALEEDKKYTGMGKALYVSALLYSDTNSNYFRLSENAFLCIAEFLGANEDIRERIQANNSYPTPFNSLVSFKGLSFKTGTYFSRLEFNHDLIAEKGIAYIHETKYTLNFTLDRFETERLISVCVKHQEFNAALNLLVWLRNQHKDYPIENLFSFLKENFQYLSSKGLLNYSQTLTKEQRKIFAKKILQQDKFFELASNIVSHALRVWQSEPFGKNKAREILNQDAFFNLSYQIVSIALKIFQNDPFGKKKAEEILEQDKFFELPFGIVSNALRICQNDTLGKKKAEEILNHDEFFELPFAIVSHALRICQNDTLGKNKAEEILNHDELLKLPKEIISNALRICKNDALGKNKAKEILELKEFFKLPHQIVINVLKIWQNEAFGKSKAKEILDQDEFLKLPKEIVTIALRIWQNEAFGKSKAEEILNHDELLKLPKEIVTIALKICQDDTLGKNKAEDILSQNELLKLPKEITSTALRICQDEEFGKSKAREVLVLLLENKNIEFSLIFNSLKSLYTDNNRDTDEIIEKVYNKIDSLRKDKKFGKLYYDLLYIPFFQIDEHKNRVFYIINNYSYRNTINQKGQLLRILKCCQEYSEECQRHFNIKKLTREVLSNWQKDLDYQKDNNPSRIIDFHIALALSNVYSKPIAEKIAADVIAYCEDDTMLMKQVLYKTATEILNTEETYDFWE